MLPVALISCVILSLEVLVETKTTLGKTENDDTLVEAVKAILQDEGVGSLHDKMEQLQDKVVLQEKRIRVLEARDRRRSKLTAEILLKLGNLEKKCGDKQEEGTERSSNVANQHDARVTKTKVAGIKEHIKNRTTGKSHANHIHTMETNDITKADIKRRMVLEPESVGFTAYLDHNIDTMAHGHTIKSNKVLLNDGNGYNNTTGVFTVPTTGVYMFNFHFNSHYRKTLVGLSVDGNNVVDAIAVPKDSSQEMMGGNTAVLRLNAGQSVWLEDIIVDDGEIYSTPAARYATFSGVLLYF